MLAMVTSLSRNPGFGGLAGTGMSTSNFGNFIIVPF